MSGPISMDKPQVSKPQVSKPMVSIVIVSWNSRKFIEPCLNSILNQNGVSSEIILIDNHSQDGTAEIALRNFPQVKIISNMKNLLYAAACNQGIAVSNADLILLLNPDTELQTDCLERMIRYMKADPGTAALGPQMISPQGKILPSCRSFPGYLTLLWEITGLSRLFPAHPVFGSWRMGDFNFKEFHEVNQPMGSAVLIRKEVLERAGGMDERFPLFFNDVDLCYRIKKSGGRIIFFPEARVVHHVGASTGRRKIAKIYYSHSGFAKYLRKHHSRGLKPILFVCAAAALLIAAGVRIILIPFFSGKSENSIPM
ncbi:MAG: glycosyltransferase family 2 protein [candidate division Zixibacteria bacterium]|nr:glycosyltransferase family 2 protein [candidate division Zixibacteria bacterium]